ncbi:MAG TPA: Flp pilus assembly protein CpaB [Polyangiaceae bacterium]|nr:Flp pilus assembly protein CpaB [Polyangiaceae bacterium]
MKSRPVLFGVLVAVLGVVLQIVYMRRYEEQASGGERVELLVAAEPIERGKQITSDMLGVRSVPRAYVDDRAIRASDREKVLNLRAMSKVPVLQTLAWTDLIATTDEQRDLSGLVQPGNRAMPIRVMFEETLQLIRPGDFVDVLGIFGESREATVMLQRVLVLATGTETSVERSTDKKTVNRISLLTLSVSLEESQLLALAQSVGKLAAVVRNPDDQRVVDSPPDVGSDALYSADVRKTVQSPRRRAPVRLEAEHP